MAGIAILGLFIALAAAAYLGGRQVELSSQLLDKDAVPGTIDAHEMRMAMSRSIGWVMVAASAQTTQSRDASLKTVHDADEAFADAIKQYEATIRINPVEDQALLERVKSRYAEYYRQRMTYEALILAGDRDGSAVFLERDLVPVYVSAIKSAEELLNYNHGNSLTYANSIHRSVHRLYWAVAIVMVLALTCAAVLVVNLAIRRRELAELQENEEKFSKAFQSNPTGLAITEFDTGRYLEVNESFCRLMGYSPQEMIGRASVELGIWESPEERDQLFQPLLAGGSLRDLEMRTHSCDRSSKTVLVNADLIELGGKKCVLSLIQDITQRMKLERKQAELAAIVESSDDAIIGKSLMGIITTWNRGAESVFGYSPSEAIGQPVLILIPPERRHEEAEILTRITRGEAVQHFETVRTRKDGRKIFVSITISPVMDDGGRVIGASKIARDITAEKKAEEILREKQAQLVLAMDIARLAHWEFDVTKNVVAGDEKIFELLGTSSAREGGLSMSPEDYIRKFVHPADAALVAKEVALGVATTDPNFARQFEHRMIRADGSERVMLVRSRVVTGASGQTAKILGTCQDITEQKQSEVALKQSEERFSRIFESSPIPITLARLADGKILAVNESFLRMAGFLREEVVGRTSLELNVYPDPEDRAVIWHQLRQHGHLHAHEQIFRTKDGRILNHILWFDVISIGGEQCVLVFALDITERKKLEEQFFRAQRMDSIGTLAGGIAHDLNNMLGPILMAIELLKMKFTDPDSEELISMIGSSAQRGASMVSQVLSFARGIEGRRVGLQLKHVIRDIEKIANDTFLKHIQVRTVIPASLSTILGDPTQLHQVLLNLCVNARDAMPQGGMLTISAEDVIIDELYAGSIPESRPGPYVLLKVEDTGTGMPPETIAKIFDPFFTTKEVGKGTGLGLSTTLGIVKNHAGFIQVYSEPGRGTTFQVYFPAQTDGSGEIPAEVTADLPRGNGELILIVDDESTVREIARQTLEAFGYRAVVACDGVEAVRLYAGQGDEIAVAFTDITMPVMDGPTMIQVLHRLNASLPIVAASGLATDGAVRQLAELGVKHFLPKPYTAKSLLEALRQVLAAAPLLSSV